MGVNSIISYRDYLASAMKCVDLDGLWIIGRDLKIVTKLIERIVLGKSFSFPLFFSPFIPLVQAKFIIPFDFPFGVLYCDSI